jgi:hypothetical protein
MFSYSASEQMANDRLAGRRAQADDQRRAKSIVSGRRRWLVLPARRRLDAALAPRFRSC